MLQKGTVGSTYVIGGHNEQRNIEVITAICTLLAELTPKSNYQNLITYVQDRAGHDTRYAIDASKIKNELGWQPIESFESGLRKTVEWYLANQKIYGVQAKKKITRVEEVAL